MKLNHAARNEDIRWLAATGEGTEGAARRLGIGLAALEKYCRDNGLHEEWRRLAASGPRDWNLSKANQYTTKAGA